MQKCDAKMGHSSLPVLHRILTAFEILIPVTV